MNEYESQIHSSICFPIWLNLNSNIGSPQQGCSSRTWLYNHPKLSFTQ